MISFGEMKLIVFLCLLQGEGLPDHGSQRLKEFTALVILARENWKAEHDEMMAVVQKQNDRLTADLEEKANAEIALRSASYSHVKVKFPSTFRLYYGISMCRGVSLYICLLQAVLIWSKDQFTSIFFVNFSLLQFSAQHLTGEATKKIRN